MGELAILGGLLCGKGHPIETVLGHLKYSSDWRWAFLLDAVFAFKSYPPVRRGHNCGFDDMIAQVSSLKLRERGRVRLHRRPRHGGLRQVSWHNITGHPGVLYGLRLATRNRAKTHNRPRYGSPEDRPR